MGSQGLKVSRSQGLKVSRSQGLKVSGHRSQVTGQRSRSQVTGHGHSGQKCINKSCGVSYCQEQGKKYSFCLVVILKKWTGNKKKSITFLYLYWIGLDYVLMRNDIQSNKTNI